MSAVERLSLEDVRAGTPIACEHLHRYQLAAALCEGLRVADVCCGSGYGSQLLLRGGAAAVMGVDKDAETIERARAGLGQPPELQFLEADALEFVSRGGLSAQYDAVVMFEGIEHVDEPDRVIHALSEHVSRGTRCVVSIPNSRALGEEDNPFHRTDYDYEQALSALQGLGDQLVVLHQYPAEGSLIRGESAEALDAELVLAERAEPNLASHVLGLVNFDIAELERAGSARMQLAVSPLDRRYLLDLEAKVAELWDELGTSQRNLDLVLSEIKGIEESVSWRVTKPLRGAKRRLGRSSNQP